MEGWQEFQPQSLQLPAEKRCCGWPTDTLTVPANTNTDAPPQSCSQWISHQEPAGAPRLPQGPRSEDSQQPDSEAVHAFEQGMQHIKRHWRSHPDTICVLHERGAARYRSTQAAESKNPCQRWWAATVHNTSTTALLGHLAVGWYSIPGWTTRGRYPERAGKGGRHFPKSNPCEVVADQGAGVPTHSNTGASTT